jgi:hypothetical protein
MADFKEIQLFRLPDIQKEALEKFGEARNFYDAGFILLDGRLLRRPRGTLFHNYVMDEGGGPGDYARRFVDTGAVRFSRQIIGENDVVLAEFTVVPTEAQLAMIRAAVDVRVHSLSLDFTDRVTHRPVVFNGKILTLHTVLPTLKKINEFMAKVKEAAGEAEGKRT